jgi:hypothetical protein
MGVGICLRGRPKRVTKVVAARGGDFSSLFLNEKSKMTAVCSCRLLLPSAPALDSVKPDTKLIIDRNQLRLAIGKESAFAQQCG